MSINNKPVTLYGNRYILSVSFANYTKAKSGMPKVILEHQEFYNKSLIDYIYIFSVKKTLGSDEHFLFSDFGLIVNGDYIGVLSVSNLIDLLTDLNRNGIVCSAIHIHHLLYLNLNKVFHILDAIDYARVYIFLHDYYYCCTNYTLRKNGLTYCGNGRLGSDRCRDCRFLEKSIKMESRLHSFFLKYATRIQYVSPSEMTKEIYYSFLPELFHDIIVVPHQVPVGTYNGNLNKLEDNQLIRIAFLGHCVPHKGWETFKKLTELGNNTKYQFFVFNNSGVSSIGLKHIPVSVSKQNPTAMTDALRDEKIDVCLLWARSPETYSYTCMEAHAANAFVLTCKGSGNIERYVQSQKNGLIIRNEEELIELFKNPEKLKQIINQYKVNNKGGPEKWMTNPDILNLCNRDNIQIGQRLVYVRQSLRVACIEKLYACKMKSESGR